MCSRNSRFRPNFTLNHFSSPGWVESEYSQSLWGLSGASARPHPSPAGGSAEYCIHPLGPAACLWSTPQPTSKIDTHDKKQKRQGKLCDLCFTADHWSPPIDLKLLFEGRPLSISLLGYDVADFLDRKSFKVETDRVIPLLHHRGRSLNNTREEKKMWFALITQTNRKNQFGKTKAT